MIEDPRGCGKTTTGAHHSATVTQVDSAGSLAAASIDPRLLFGGAHGSGSRSRWELTTSMRQQPHCYGSRTLASPDHHQHLIVVTTTEYAYTRPDGVSVVPLGTLTR